MTATGRVGLVAFSTARVPVTPLQRIIVGAGAAVVALVDPGRADMVALLGELTGEPALRSMLARMRADRDGAAILAERPRVRLEQLQPLLTSAPDGSFGSAYRAYLDRHGFNPDERHDTRCVDDPDLAYVMQRYREVHDFWHVLAGMPPSVMGELVVKWLEMVHTGLPMAAMSALVAPIRLPPPQRALLARVYVPWAWEVGRSARDLMCVRYEAPQLLHAPLDDVRRQLRFTPAPPLPVEAPPSPYQR